MLQIDQGIFAMAQNGKIAFLDNYQTTPCLSIGINALPISMTEHSIVQRKEAGNGPSVNQVLDSLL